MAMLWRKSRRSTSGTSGECVEIADLNGAVGIRDSKAPEAGHLRVSRAELGRLVNRVRSGRLDL